MKRLFDVAGSRERKLRKLLVKCEETRDYLRDYQQHNLGQRQMTGWLFDECIENNLSPAIDAMRKVLSHENVSKVDFSDPAMKGLLKTCEGAEKRVRADLYQVIKEIESGEWKL